MTGRWGFDPVIYELNTAAWLHDVGQHVGQSVTLADVPDDEWDRVTPRGVDAVWLMGVWRRSAEGVRLALDSPSHLADFHAALADFTPDDVIGSAYSIAGYMPDARFGGEPGLAAARRALLDRGMRLIVDFVPNHVAPDHPWLTSHPEYFVRGDADDLSRAPTDFLAVGAAIIARGRDPYFPPWPDVAQLNAFAPGLRRAAAGTLVDIGTQADGVRCDMAMLLLSEVFARTWGARAGVPLEREYWTDVMEPVPLQDVERIKAAGLNVLQGPELRTIFLGMDQKRDELQFSNVKGKNPFKDVRVRRAFYQAIDEETIKSRVMRGAALPTGLMVGAAVRGFQPDMNKRLPYDPEAAKKLLAEAGYPNVNISPTISHPENSKRRKLNDI
jgi:hypothetical protein